MIGVNVMFRKWVKVCEVVGVIGFQFCDLWVKVVIDKVEFLGDVCVVQKQMGYLLVVMIEYYMCNWCGVKVMLMW